MADKLSKEKRSWNMSRIRGKNTSIEILVRKYLFSKGFRFRLHVSNLAGKPDLVLPKYKSVIFVNGCFWHHHSDCKLAYIPKSNMDFWKKKFERNQSNDYKNYNQLKNDNWNIIVVWECELRNNTMETLEDIEKCILQRKSRYNG